VSPSSTTNYSVTGTSSAGCVSTNTAVSSVTVNALPVVSAASNMTYICVGQTATLTATGGLTYTWSTGGNTSAEIITPTVTTSYTVTGTAANTCSNTAVITQSVSTCTGIQSEDESLLSGVSVYPNPNNGEFFIHLSILDGNTRIEIFNTLGSRVVEKVITSQTEQIDLKDLSNGIYYIHITNNMNNKTILKIIKR
jgi:hypothetical protein